MVDDKASSSGRGRYDAEEEERRVFNAASQAWGEGVSDLLNYELRIGLLTSGF